jgi:hypothetical protein
MRIKIPKSKCKITKTRYVYDDILGIHIFTIKGVNRHIVIKDIPLILRNPKAWIKRQYYLTKGSIKKNYKIFSLWFKEVVLRNPIYAYSYSIDCDLRESCHYIKFNSRNEFNEYEYNLYESAEGQTFINRISEEEYLNN